jgi:hypothetical protein
MAEVYRAGAKKGERVSETVPNLMARVKIERAMEGLRRERERAEASIQNERTRAETTGMPVNDAILNMLRKEIQKIDDQIEEKIEELQGLEVPSDDSQDS